jgi:SecD/SecF fusion protein
MNVWLKSFLIGAVAAAVAFFINKNSRHVNRKLVTVDLIVEIFPDESISSREFTDVMVQLPEIIKHRCEAAGYSASVKFINENKELQISIEHVDDVSRARYLATSNSKLEFRELYTLAELASCFSSTSEAAQKFYPPNPDTNQNNKPGIGRLLNFSIDRNGRFAENAAIGSVMKKDTSLLNQIFRDPSVLKSFPKDVRFAYGPLEMPGKTKNQQIFLNFYAIKIKMQEAALQNKHIMHAKAGKSFNGQPELIFQFNSVGSKIWERMTTENRGRYVAIIIDKNVISAPRVLDAISGGNTSISGGFKPEETETLALLLNAGYIPVKLFVVELHSNPEKPSSNGKNMILPMIIFVITVGISFVIFYSLKRK